MLRLHAASLARAAEARESADAVAACQQAYTQLRAHDCYEPSPDRDLRSREADLAEIAHLNRRVEELEAQLAACPRDDDRAPDPLASPPKERKAYAVDPLGKPLPTPTEVEVVDRPNPADAFDYIHLTNLGGLMDVLA